MQQQSSVTVWPLERPEPRVVVKLDPLGFIVWDNLTMRALEFTSSKSHARQRAEWWNS